MDAAGSVNGSRAGRRSCQLAHRMPKAPPLADAKRDASALRSRGRAPRRWTRAISRASRSRLCRVVARLPTHSPFLGAGHASSIRRGLSACSAGRPRRARDRAGCASCRCAQGRRLGRDRGRARAAPLPAEPRAAGRAGGYRRRLGRRDGDGRLDRDRRRVGAGAVERRAAEAARSRPHHARRSRRRPAPVPASSCWRSASMAPAS